MRQMLLRVEDDLHARLVERAGRSGRSLNALATELLERNVEDESPDTRADLRARARKLGVLASHPSPTLTDETRERAIASMRGVGRFLDDIFADGR